MNYLALFICFLLGSSYSIVATLSTDNETSECTRTDLLFIISDRSCAGYMHSCRKIGGGKREKRDRDAGVGRGLRKRCCCCCCRKLRKYPSRWGLSRILRYVQGYLCPSFLVLRPPRPTFVLKQHCHLESSASSVI